MDKVHPKVEEAVETLNMKDSPSRRKLLKGTGLVSATAAASALLAACSSSSSPAAATTTKDTAGNFPKTPAWQFWFVNHVTTNPFFVPTQYGFDGRRYQRRGCREGRGHRDDGDHLHRLHHADQRCDDRRHPGHHLQR
jgi:hypothetical protein